MSLMNLIEFLQFLLRKDRGHRRHEAQAWVAVLFLNHVWQGQTNVLGQSKGLQQLVVLLYGWLVKQRKQDTIKICGMEIKCKE